MSQAPKADTPFRSVDAHGRAVPMTEEEIRARNEIAIPHNNGRDAVGGPVLGGIAAGRAADFGPTRAGRDCILASLAAGPDDSVVVATANVGHLGRFVDARPWETVTA